MRVWTAIGVLVLATLLAQPVSAADGSEITAQASTLWWHANDEAVWINTLQADPAHSVDTDGYNGLVYVAGLGAAVFELPMAPALTKAAPLDPAGEVTFYAYPGGSIADVGVIDSVDFLLTAGGETISEATATGPFVLEGSPTEISASGAVALADIPGGAELLWTITFYGASGQLVLSGAEGSWTRVELPVLSPAASGGGDDGDDDTGGEADTGDDEPELVEEEASGPTFARTIEFDGGDAMHVYSWTMPEMQEAHVRFDVQAESGVAYFGVADPDSEDALVEWTTEESGVFEDTVPITFDGDVLEIGLFAEGFTGTIEILVEPVVPEETEAPQDMPAEEPADTTTVPVQEVDSGDDGNDAPGLWLPVVAMVLLAVVGVRTRR